MRYWTLCITTAILFFWTKVHWCGLLTVLSLLTRWKWKFTWSMSRLWDPCCPCLSVFCMAAKVLLLLEQTSGWASGLMTLQPIRHRKMLTWGWGCMQHWALHKVRMAISTLHYNNFTYIVFGVVFFLFGKECADMSRYCKYLLKLKFLSVVPNVAFIHTSCYSCFWLYSLYTIKITKVALLTSICRTTYRLNTQLLV